MSNPRKPRTFIPSKYTLYTVHPCVIHVHVATILDEADTTFMRTLVMAFDSNSTTLKLLDYYNTLSVSVSQ